MNNEEGFFKDREEKAFTEKDFRFTYKRGSIYAFQMRPNGENAVIKALKKHNAHDFIIKGSRCFQQVQCLNLKEIIMN